MKPPTMEPWFMKWAKRIEELEKEVNELKKNQHYHHSPPWSDPFVTKSPVLSRCSKCGIDLTKPISYSCPNIDCPCGMGPVMCGVTNA